MNESLLEISWMCDNGADFIYFNKLTRQQRDAVRNLILEWHNWEYSQKIWTLDEWTIRVIKDVSGQVLVKVTTPVDAFWRPYLM